MQIEIWSDVICPWCYVGKRRFEKALAQFSGRDKVSIVWRSFELDPEAPRQHPGTLVDLLAHKYGVSSEQAAAMERIMQAYFGESLPVGERAALARLAPDFGIPESEAMAMLESDAWGDAVRADEARAARFGISGVPFFVLDEKTGVSGAQEVQVFAKALEEAA